MEYPGAHFVRPWRRLMLVVFIAAFFVLAPAIVLYTTGYRYDWKYGLLRETGSISIDVLPRTATVSLDGLELPDKIPVRLKNITPHTYLLNITAPGYYDWTKEIAVQNRETTYIKDISLIKKGRPEFLTKAKVVSLIKPGAGRYIIFIDEQKGSTVVRRLNTQTSLTETILVTTASTTLQCAPSNSWCTMTEATVPKPRVLVFDTELPELTYPDNFIDISSLVTPAIKKILWDSDSSPTVYFSTASTIYALPITSRQVQTLGSTSGWDWYAHGGTLWTLTTTTSTNQIVINKTTNGLTTPGFTIAASKLPEPRTITLAEVQGSQALLLTDNGTHIVTNDHLWSFPTTQFLRSPFNNWLILYGSGELWGKENSADPILIYRASEPILSITSLDQYNTLALLTPKRLTALFHYYLVAQDIVTKKITSVVVDTIGKNVYYADKDGLWQVAY